MGNPEEENASVPSGEVNTGYVLTEEKVDDQKPPPYTPGISSFFNDVTKHWWTEKYLPVITCMKENKVAETSETVDVDARIHNPNFQNENDGMKPIRLMSPAEIKSEKIRIWKNVTVISLSFMCLFTAFNSVSNLQVDTPLSFNLFIAINN